MAVPIVYQNFIPPAIDAGNLNTINNVVYTVIGDGVNAPLNGANVRTNIGALAATGGTAVNLNSTNPTVTGGLITGANVSASTITNPTFVGVTLSFRNKLINGTGAFNQRSYSSGAAVGSPNTYTLDRWRVVTNGQALTFAANSVGNVMTAPAGGLEQVIEGNNIEGGVYTVSWVGSATCTVNGVSVTNGGQTAVLPSNTNVTVRFTGGTVQFAQFEFGNIASAFEFRPFAVELLLCQRYLPSWTFTSTSDDICSGSLNSTSGGVAFVYFPTEARVPPTSISFTNVANFNFTAPLVSSVLTALTFLSAGKKSARLTFVGTGTPFTATQPGSLFGNTIGSVLYFNGCEL